LKAPAFQTPSLKIGQTRNFTPTFHSAKIGQTDVSVLERIESRIKTAIVRDGFEQQQAHRERVQNMLLQQVPLCKCNQGDKLMAGMFSKATTSAAINSVKSLQDEGNSPQDTVQSQTENYFSFIDNVEDGIKKSATRGAVNPPVRSNTPVLPKFSPMRPLIKGKHNSTLNTKRRRRKGCKGNRSRKENHDSTQASRIHHGKHNATAFQGHVELSTVIPPGVAQGQQFIALCNHKHVLVTCPWSKTAGDTIRLIVGSSKLLSTPTPVPPAGIPQYRMAWSFRTK
jgi:hypothetical protein